MATVRGFDFPAELRYLLEQDTWARLEPGGLVTVGLTSLGGHISGDFIDFTPKAVGTRIERDRSLGALEMSKVIRSARSPVAGEVAEVNAAVRENPGLINADPYGEGWLVRLRPEDWDRDAALLVAADGLGPAVLAYMELLSESFGVDVPPA
ncbi:Glycine cleavage system H protein [Usitatibacter rugosus]|uniref:Glycine cleavage system H protein n=1 Tax=Usitatibacter rugosus TaxID=2732067 RepID=A0A6M4GS28_9PROT|nr:glycine cleavage system protein H [Usitatibacter rugosus]QJR09284.1 Glycine cleavage system H protein [Usitatibacter rugosus]